MNTWMNFNQFDYIYTPRLVQLRQLLCMGRVNRAVGKFIASLYILLSRFLEVKTENLRTLGWLLASKGCL